MLRGRDGEAEGDVRVLFALFGSSLGPLRGGVVLCAVTTGEVEAGATRCGAECSVTVDWDASEAAEALSASAWRAFIAPALGEELGIARGGCGGGDGPRERKGGGYLCG